MSNFETLNSGEWSELYAALKILASRTLHGANHLLEAIPDELCQVVHIEQEQRDTNNKMLYRIHEGQIYVEIDGETVSNVSEEACAYNANTILNNIRANVETTYSIPDIQTLLDIMQNPKLKSSTRNKRDLTLCVVEPCSGSRQTFGFSVKSNLGSASTLLNASAHTNFVFTVADNIPLETTLYAKKLIRELAHIKFEGLDSAVYTRNLELIDSQFPKIASLILLYYFQGLGTKMPEIVSIMQERNPLNVTDTSFYKVKVRQFLLATALGMVPNTEWSTLYDADGGMIVVKEDGSLVSFYIFKQSLLLELSGYLFANSFLDTPSTTRHKFGRLYHEDGIKKVKLNLQIRLK